MKLPQRTIQWICFALAAYFAWGICWVLYSFGLSQPKALFGAVIGMVVCGAWGMVTPTPQKSGAAASGDVTEKKKPIQAAETTRGK